MLAFCVHLAWLFCLRWGQISVGAHCCSFGCWRLIRAFVVVSWNVLTTLLCFNSWYFFLIFIHLFLQKKYDKIKQKPSFLHFWKVFQQKHIFFQYYHSLNLTKKSQISHLFIKPLLVSVFKFEYLLQAHCKDVRARRRRVNEWIELIHTQRS